MHVIRSESAVLCSYCRVLRWVLYIVPVLGDHDSNPLYVRFVSRLKATGMKRLSGTGIATPKREVVDHGRTRYRM